MLGHRLADNELLLNFNFNNLLKYSEYSLHPQQTVHKHPIQLSPA